MRAVLAIDGGGTRTRCAAVFEDGRVAATVESGPSNHLQVPREVVARSLATAIAGAIEAGGLRGVEIACVCAGMAGVDYDGTGREGALEIFRDIGYPDAVVHSDMVIAHRGALAGEPGGMALAGTGSVFLGIDAAGRMARAGGWGPVFGDEGSGYWIGAEALRAASHASDGRGAATLLVEELPRALGVPGFDRVTAVVYRQGARPTDVAALAPVVAEVAAQGDAVAAEILRRAGEHLAAGVVALARKMAWDAGRFPVSYQGGVLARCEPVRRALEEALRRVLPAADLLAPRFEPVMGAFLLATVGQASACGGLQPASGARLKARRRII